MAEIVNGWYLSQKNGEWQAVCKGEIGIRHKDHHVVYEWARWNAPSKGNKK